MWQLSAVANLVLLFVYLAISFVIMRALIRSGQWRENKLGLATAAIFFSCAVHHGSHPVHMLLPYVGLEEHVGLSMRDAFSEWHVAYWDVITAGIGIWYLSLRRHYEPLMQGAKLFEDMKERERQALQINDDIVQGLTVAKLSLEMGREAESVEALRTTLISARALITDLLEGQDPALAQGSARRSDVGEAVRE